MIHDTIQKFKIIHWENNNQSSKTPLLKIYRILVCVSPVNNILNYHKYAIMPLYI